jgi:phosphatidylserine synthase
MLTIEFNVTCKHKCCLIGCSMRQYMQCVQVWLWLMHDNQSWKMWRIISIETGTYFKARGMISASTYVKIISFNCKISNKIICVFILACNEDLWKFRRTPTSLWNELGTTRPSTIFYRLLQNWASLRRHWERSLSAVSHLKIKISSKNMREKPTNTPIIHSVY